MRGTHRAIEVADSGKDGVDCGWVRTDKVAVAGLRQSVRMVPFKVRAHQRHGVPGSSHIYERDVKADLSLSLMIFSLLV